MRSEKRKARNEKRKDPPLADPNNDICLLSQHQHIIFQYLNNSSVNVEE